MGSPQAARRERHPRAAVRRGVRRDRHRDAHAADGRRGGRQGRTRRSRSSSWCRSSARCRSSSSAPTSSSSGCCRSARPASGRRRSRSPSPRPAATPPRCARTPCRTATSGSSTARRTGSPTRAIADFYVVFAADRPREPPHHRVRRRGGPARPVASASSSTSSASRARPPARPSSRTCASRRRTSSARSARASASRSARCERTRLGAAAQAVGIAQGATDYAARTRASASRSASRSASTRRSRFKLADMETGTAAARELLYKACALADRNEPQLAKYTSMAKLFASDNAMRVTIEAIQVLGGYGYVKEYPVERMMRDAKITQIYEGTNEVQRLVIARSHAVAHAAARGASCIAAVFALCSGLSAIALLTGSTARIRSALLETLALVVLGRRGHRRRDDGDRAAHGRLARPGVRAGVRPHRRALRAPGPRRHERRAGRDGVHGPRPVPRRATSRSSSARRSTSCPTCCRRRCGATSASSSPTTAAGTAPTACTAATASRATTSPTRSSSSATRCAATSATTPTLLREQVTITVRHELAHHLGADELGVRDLGL